MKIKDVSHRVKVDATQPSLIGSISIGILSDVTPDGDRVIVLDAEQVKKN